MMMMMMMEWSSTKAYFSKAYNSSTKYYNRISNSNLLLNLDVQNTQVTTTKTQSLNYCQNPNQNST